MPKVFKWRPIETAPKDGREILICLPGGQSDHFHVVCWEDGPRYRRWQSRHSDQIWVTEAQIADCHRKPMWTEIPYCPTSLCYGIKPLSKAS